MKRLSGEQEAARLVVGFLRSLRGWTQEEFGTAAGLDRGTIGRYESGKIRVSRKVLRQLATVAGIRPERLPQLLALFRQIGHELGTVGGIEESLSVREEMAADVAAEVSASIESEILKALAGISFEMEVDEAGDPN